MYPRPATPPAPATTEGARGGLERPGALAALSLASFAATLGGSAIAIALPALGRDLDIGPAHLPWVVTAYSLVYGSLLLLFGRIGDLHGRRRVLLGGLAAFTGASVLGAVAPVAWFLLAARIVQGAAAAAFTAAALALVASIYRESSVRKRAIGVFSAAGATGFAMGAALGGVVTDLLSWRAALVAPAVLAAAVFAAGWVVLHRDPAADGASTLDVPGAATMSLAIGLLLYGLASSGTHGWSSPITLGALAGGALMAWAFVGVERRSSAPLIPLDALAVPGVATVAACLFLFSASGATTYLFAVYLQDVEGRAAWEAGLLYLPLPLTGALLAPVAGSVIDRIGGLRRAAVVGVLVTIAGWLAMSVLMALGGPVGALVVCGVAVVVGRVIAIVAMTVRLTSSMGEERRGLAAGLVTTAMELGLATALATFSAAIGAGVTADGARTDTLAAALLVGALVIVGLLVGAVVAAAISARVASDAADD